MTPEEIYGLLDGLNPDNRHISDALAFIRLVTKNNPKKTPAQIFARPDVAEAFATIQDWLNDTEAAAAAVIATLPLAAQGPAEKSITETLSKMQTDLDPENRIGEYQANPDDETWAPKFILRLIWLLDVLRVLLQFAALGAPYKRWVSRLDPKTCTFCRGLHGVILPLDASFAVEAAKVGYTRIYGGLFAPPLHPRCRCRLEPVTQAEYDQATGRYVE